MKQIQTEWFHAHLGKFTASNIDSFVGKIAKDLPTSKYEEYKLRFITKCLRGETVSFYEMPAIKWGNKRKERVIKKYSLEREITVTRCGFIPHPTIEMASAIPDGLIGDGGLIKVKYSQPTTHVRFLLDGKIKPEYILQMQFQMACTGRKWCDFVSIILG
ncbi:YqaJ-like recombinase domain-containing protein [Bartonella schoenbuchensis R1]|uniref:YqaJ-like recombinase domain-containing protein n=1 Tax=Bartonella schoenbuchensis (strain DSM 13525 / NCTC 13165 / R1) TaxID=687861 RepID=A0A1S6XRV1_BARSR|nr:YqaJ-like recombinase domain-containing protein [Bartonella schoenbuchensis R1]